MKYSDLKKQKEGFKGGRGSGGAAGGAASSMLSNSGMQLHTGGVTMCPPSDQTFYCQLNRFFGYISYFLTAVALIYIFYVFVWPYIAKKGRGLFSGGKRR
jgi:hypothetical protein